MRPDKADPALLWDMLDAARAVRGFLEGKSAGDYLGTECSGQRWNERLKLSAKRLAK
jgi:hypothetical protein